MPKTHKQRMGDRLKETRELKGWSQAELSKRTDGVLSPSRIGNYEQGTRAIKPPEAAILAKALGTSPAYVMCLESEDMTQEERQLLVSWRALPEKDRMQYLRRISSLAIVYRDAVPDEQLEHLASPTAKRRKARKGQIAVDKPAQQ
jgi:transcriptional regulator with XRE-family HTH domain